MPWKLTYARGIVAQCLCVVGVVFWSVPVTTIQLLSNARSLRQLLPGVFALSQHWSKLFRTLLVKYVPVVALILLLALLPIIFEAGARRYERYKVKSDVHRTVLNRLSATLGAMSISLQATWVICLQPSMSLGRLTSEDHSGRWRWCLALSRALWHLDRWRLVRDL